MKQYSLRILIALNVLLGGALVAAWVDTQGQLRDVHWLAPEEHRPDVLLAPSALQDQSAADVNRFVATLDRPLFSPSRRPPPPPPPPTPVVVVDPLAGIQLYGVFSSGSESGGIIARVSGKVQRILLQEKLGDWTLKSIQGRDVTLERAGGEVRVLSLQRAKGPPTPDPAAQPAPSGPIPATAPAANAGGFDPVAAELQRLAQEQRERLARRNAIRAKAGLPPLKE